MCFLILNPVVTGIFQNKYSFNFQNRMQKVKRGMNDITQEMGALLWVGSFLLFLFERGAFSLKYSFETESEINFLSNPHFKTGSICRQYKKCFLGFELFNSF